MVQSGEGRIHVDIWLKYSVHLNDHTATPHGRICYQIVCVTAQFNQYHNMDTNTRTQSTSSAECGAEEFRTILGCGF